MAAKPVAKAKDATRSTGGAACSCCGLPVGEPAAVSCHACPRRFCSEECAKGAPQSRKSCSLHFASAINKGSGACAWCDSGGLVPCVVCKSQMCDTCLNELGHGMLLYDGQAACKPCINTAITKLIAPRRKGDAKQADRPKKQRKLTPP